MLQTLLVHLFLEEFYNAIILVVHVQVDMYVCTSHPCMLTFLYLGPIDIETFKRLCQNSGHLIKGDTIGTYNLKCVWIRGGGGVPFCYVIVDSTSCLPFCFLALTNARWVIIVSYGNLCFLAVDRNCENAAPTLIA